MSFLISTLFVSIGVLMWGLLSEGSPVKAISICVTLFWNLALGFTLLAARAAHLNHEAGMGLSGVLLPGGAVIGLSLAAFLHRRLLIFKRDVEKLKKIRLELRG